jgi:voltage-gated potassium channel
MGGEKPLKALIHLPRRRVSPMIAFGRRIAYATIVVLVMFVIVALGRSGYRDNVDGTVSIADALYYTTVSISTTGYGDIVPVTTTARMITALVITPLRVLFLAILVGTAFEVLTQRTRDEFRISRWRSKLRDHTVVIGYGTKGHSAIATLLASGRARDRFLVVDKSPDLIAEANADGVAGIVGDAARTSVLREAKVADAGCVIIAAGRDDTAVLVTLTARQLNKTAVIVAAIREAENEPLVLQSGANAVITSAEAAGRLLGFAALSPNVSQVFGDLLVHGSGLEIVERLVRADEVGSAPVAGADQIIAIVRSGAVLPFNAALTLTSNDHVVVVRSQPQTP